MIDENTELLTAEQISDHLGIQPETLSRWVSQGKFPRGVRLGGSHRMTRWERETYRAWLRGEWQPETSETTPVHNRAADLSTKGS